MDSNYKFLGYLPQTEKLSVLSEVAKTLDWENNEFGRDEVALKTGKYLEFPFVVKSKRDDIKYSHVTGDLCGEIFSHINSLYPNCVYIRGEMAALLPGVEILAHTDGKWFHKYSHRIHVPLHTNEDCKNVFKDEHVHFDKYSVYEINNRVMHYAYNKGSVPRIHLIFDLMPKDIYESVDQKTFNSRA